VGAGAGGVVLAAGADPVDPRSASRRGRR
jgi:hypothetical protein